MWKSSVKDIDGDILCVSQFTLYGNTSKGNKPDFHNAMNAVLSRDLYQAFVGSVRASYISSKVKGKAITKFSC